MLTEKNTRKSDKGIFFDIGHTLCYPVSNDWRLTKKFYDSIDMNIFHTLGKERIVHAISESLRFLNEHHRLWTVEEEYEQNIDAYKILADCLPELHLPDERIRDIAYDRTYNMDNYCFYDGLKELFQRLSPKYKIGIISDTWPSADNVLRQAGIYEYIDTFTYSCNLGVCKPNPAMFSDAVEKMGIAPENTIFVDDSEKNLEAAAALGMNPVMILTRSDKSQNGYPVIHRISEMETAIDYYFG
ncbi:MAG: HAD-IA family hydrolase [Lachnospiraceae bacterium]|nr:HAD-IA family hydrolase [Lachnospiraceae bacterium]